MRTISVTYPTITRHVKMKDKLFVLEAIRDLDEAIDLICEAMTPEEKLDPFAEDLCPYFGILWPSSIGLAQYLENHPELVKNKTILELGCGLGLPSLMAKFLGAQVLATDFHPDVEKYFLRNCRHSSLECRYQRLNWREDSLSQKFDVVIGSDVLYESKHPKEVAKGLIKYLKPKGKMILSDPGRAYLQQFIDAMKAEGLNEELAFERVQDQDVFILRYQI